MTESVVYGGQSSARVRIHHLQQAKERGEKWAMLTAYDTYSAAIFEEAGIPVLLVGDSSGNVVLGYSSTVPVTVDDLLLMTKAVTRSTNRALIVSDLPFGSYESGPQQAFDTAVRFMKEGGAQAVKLEGGERVAPQIRLLHDSGIPVMAHIGFTPQSEHSLGGFRVQGRGTGAEQLLADAHAVQEAGAFAVVLEMVPATIAGQVTKELSIPTIGIGAGVDCDAQVLVWPDMAGLNGGRVPKFVKKYADLRGELLRATREFADEVHGGVFPAPEHSFD
ncbi:3-methyl-2-oxobutanoate hydroxymethyltransferase [Blastococcus haudaquaticus]|uniref:3-methyl-2-oxobutanoate hydroxymethyltransferase n=1 Tax=Blastococcus haudaquaticus TaxID=1938745 RepID=A0A286H585_9ACTN|nr:3-methyl-2-oxobutanoate hydroxymethyltransferase [Blastococcus haudaquaticus]SOE02921.1 3-methyl-2-oxobutanoate hydroxymethyltransferase [Blastococcus haudaquaticus]